jgi:hypothetical protein
MKLFKFQFRTPLALAIGPMIICAILPLRAEEMLKRVRTIPLPGVEGRFDHFAVDEKGARLFVAALGNNTVEIIDLKDGHRLQSISNMHKPTGIAYVPESNRICVGNGDDGSLKILDGESYKVLRSITAFDDADNVRFDAKHNQIYLGYGNGALAILDLAGGKTPGAVKLKGHPESFQLEQTGNRIFVNVPDAGQIAVIDRDKREVVQTWPLQHHANFPMALDEPGHRLFVGFRGPSRLVTFDTETGKAVSDLEISGDTDDLFYDAKRRRIYISAAKVLSMWWSRRHRTNTNAPQESQRTRERALHFSALVAMSFIYPFPIVVISRRKSEFTRLSEIPEETSMPRCPSPFFYLFPSPPVLNPARRNKYILHIWQKWFRLRKRLRNGH